ERTIIINLVLALFLSGLIGYEREHHDRPAGLRTHILVCMGATIIMMISLAMHDIHVENDAGRIAAQVVSGVGFLGAGTIMKEGFSVKGLTTAASLWATAAIGLAIGGNYYFLAVSSTLMVIIILYLLNSFDFSSHSLKHETLRCRINNKNDILDKITDIMQSSNIKIENVAIKKSGNNVAGDNNELMVVYNLERRDKEKYLNIANDLLKYKEILEVNIES
ncbi:MAG: MgtC/SapB family protein, partial [Bacillota bacterium]